MRILYCIPTLDYGGAERQLSYLAAELARMGHEVHVASRFGGPNLERMVSAGVVWHQLEVTRNENSRRFFGLTRIVRVFVIFLRLVRLIRTLRPDLVQTILAPMDILGGAAAFLTGTPWVLKECSSALIYRTYRRYWFRYLFGRLSDMVVSNSAHSYEYWRAARGTRALCMIPNGLPLVEIANVNAATGAGFKRSPHEQLVLYAGRIDIGKNVEALIAALAQISEDIYFLAVICGDGPHRAQVERMAQELGIRDRVIFPGYVNNLWALMKRADLFVSFSRCEGSPNVVLEAMASGCPLVVSDIPAHRELLDEQSAMFVKLDQPAVAVEAIRNTLLDTSSARRRAVTAQVNAAERPIEASARQHERVYLRLVSDTSELREIPILPAAGCADANKT